MGSAEAGLPQLKENLYNFCISDTADTSDTGSAQAGQAMLHLFFKTSYPVLCFITTLLTCIYSQVHIIF